MAARSSSPIVVTGARSALGRLVLERLARTPARLIVIDIERPPQKVRYYPLNLTEPNTDIELERIFREEKCRTVLHLAYLARPIFDVGYSHEIQSIGTLSVLHAAREAGVHHIVTVSPSAVYGAQGQNPNFITEEHPIHPHRDYEYLQDRVEADQHVIGLMEKHSDIAVTLLRIPPTLGPLSDNLTTRMLSADTTVTLFGYDPLLQFVHEDDAADAVLRALEYHRSAIFNIAADGVMPLSTALYHAGVVGIPVAHPIAYALFHAMWIMRLNPVPAPQLDFLRYPCVLDTALAQRDLKFRPRLTTQGALFEYLNKKKSRAA